MSDITTTRSGAGPARGGNGPSGRGGGSEATEVRGGRSWDGDERRESPQLQKHDAQAPRLPGALQDRHRRRPDHLPRLDSVLDPRPQDTRNGDDKALRRRHGHGRGLRRHRLRLYRADSPHYPRALRPLGGLHLRPGLDHGRHLDEDFVQTSERHLRENGQAAPQVLRRNNSRRAFVEDHKRRRRDQPDPEPEPDAARLFGRDGRGRHRDDALDQLDPHPRRAGHHAHIPSLRDRL